MCSSIIAVRANNKSAMCGVNMSQASITLIVEFEIIDYSRYIKAAKILANYINESEPGVLRHDWYVAPDKKSGRLLERYKNRAALEGHLVGPATTEYGLEFIDVVNWTSMQTFGALPELFVRMFTGVFPHKNWPVPGVTLNR